MNKIKLYIITHKIISTIVLVIILGVGFFIYKKNTSTTGETRYVLGTVIKGTIISSVSGSGQVSASNQIDIKPNVSGAITYLGIQPGNKVGNGQLLISIDNTQAQKTVRDAEIALEAAQISLNKLQIQNSDTNLTANLAKAYDDGFTSVSSTFLDLPGIMGGLNDMFFTSNISKNGQWSVDWYEAQVSSGDSDAVKPYKQAFLDSYQASLTAYKNNSESYKSASRTSNSATLEALINETYNDVKLISTTIKNANNYIDFVNSSIKKVNNNTPPAAITTNLSTLSGYTSKINTDLQNLLSIETQIQGAKDTSANSTLDTQSQELDITQKQNALQDAKDNLLNYSIRAPFSGTITSVPVQKGDNVSSGTTLATLITTTRIATISLNEIDIAKIQLGQKVTLTFDAVPDITITGKVAQIDSIGTVSQGVVNYNVKISFDTNDTRIKPGMSVNAAIITGVKQDVLTVPNSAVKNQGGSTFVGMFDTPLPAPLPGVQGSISLVPPRNQTVAVGISNSTSTEILSGLNEGDEVVTRIITQKTAAATTAPSILGTPTGGGRGGSAIRIGG